jgi:tRNA U38,U39,U40 pseudouridine synthase TruA
MTTETIIILLGVVAFLIITAGFFVWLTVRSCVRAALNAKPTANYYGDVKNYFTHEEKENLKTMDDDKLLLLAECAGKFLQTIRGELNDKRVRKNRTLKK